MLYLEPYVSLQIEFLGSTNRPVRVECDIIHGRPDTLSLRHYKEVLVEVFGTHLNYTQLVSLELTHATLGLAQIQHWSGKKVKSERLCKHLPTTATFLCRFLSSFDY